MVYATTYPGQINIAALADAGSPGATIINGTVENARVGAVTLNINGSSRPVSVMDGRFTYKVSLAPGRNSIQATVDGMGSILFGGSNIITIQKKNLSTTESSPINPAVDGSTPDKPRSDPASSPKIGAPNCDCMGVDFGLLTGPYRKQCNGREQQLLSLAADGKLNLRLGNDAKIASGEFCDPAASGPRAWPLQGAPATPPQGVPRYQECKPQGLIQKC